MSYGRHNPIPERLRLEAVACVARGELLLDVAKRLGLHPSTLRSWVAIEGRVNRPQPKTVINLASFPLVRFDET